RTFMPVAPPPPAPPPLVRQYRDLTLSPGGDRIAAVEVSATGEEAGEPHQALVVRAAADGSVVQRFDPCPACEYAAPAWSPSGERLAFVAIDPANLTATLDIAEGGRVRVAATIQGLAGTPRWSPDGASIALLATRGARKRTGAVEAGAPQVGEIGEANDEQRIAVVGAAGGEARYVSPADTFVYEYDWTPDGRGFVATAAKGNGDNNWWVARLVAIDLAGGAARTLAAPKLQMDYPRVSPDGNSVMFIGGLMSDFGPVGGDLYTVPMAGGEPRDLTPGWKGTFTSLAWRTRRPLATALVGGNTAIVSIDPVGGAARTLWSGPASLTGAAFNGEVALDAKGEHGAAVREDFEHAPAIVAGPLAAMVPITHDNDSLAPQVAAREVTWRNGGFDLQGWLLAPRNLPGGHKYPMITVVHGGPSSAAQPGFVSHGTVRDLVARGYFVFEPNPRGSYGQGEAFTRANIRDFGGGDFSDTLAGIDAVEKVAPIDDARLGVFGHSYGGFMSMWAVTHTHRFRAAVAGAGLANWISYYGQNGIDEWMIPFFGASAYDDPAIYNAASPINFIKNARTPTFIYVGERDVECPAPQSLEFWRGLSAMNVPTSLVIYPGEGHRLRQPGHVHDLRDRIVGWFDRYLGR
ncbi:MAG: prolyl oligopeptidase family serine peptidase, partial [Caulobacteraceae bacterium]